MVSLTEYNIIIKDLEGFEMGVFGADCFLRNFPHIKTTGIHVRKCEDFYYIIENGKVAGDTLFFSEEELKYFLIEKI